MSTPDPISLSIDWEKVLADDGSLPYLPGFGLAPLAPVVKRSAVAPRPRQHDGIHVTEDTDSDLMGITNCTLFVETRWSCPRCGGHFKKAGRHNGVLRTCKCGARYFLRVVPVG